MLLTWLGGGHWRELGERHERSTHAVAGVVVLFGAVLAWLVASLAVSESAHWPMPVVVALTLVFGLLVGAVTRGIASGPAAGLARHRRTRGGSRRAGRRRRRARRARRVFRLDRPSSGRTGATQRRLDAGRGASVGLPATRRAAPAARSTTPSTKPARTRTTPWSSHVANTTPRRPARRPGSPAFPVTGPETLTANELLADAQHELDNALAARDRQAPALDAEITHDEQALAEARHAVVADAGRGLGARWVAMNELTLPARAR